MKKLKIAIVGPGIVGKATGRALIEKGQEVGFIGRTYEQAERLRDEGYTAHSRTDLMKGDYDYDVTMFTVSTPTNNGKVNLDALELAAIDLGKRIKNTKDYHVAVVKSTSPPGTSEDLVVRIIEEYSGKKAGKDFGVCMNPEYLREISAYEDSINPWVILIGELDKKSGDVLEAVYENFDCPIYRCSLKEAEMQKYVHNLYNATKISFFNEMRYIGKQMGIDTEKVFKYTALSCEGMLSPQYGIKDKGAFSGACLPKDTKAFLAFSKSKGFHPELLDAVIQVNESVKEGASKRAVIEKPNGNGKHKTHHIRKIEELREAEQNADYTL